ncbi:hypothetical protein BU15DRAFT_88216 [Melanogaster broomeanus]|nr:hypothetical protein BU15DRAFT_88216 [Melanogaster broomeanus]
MDNHARQHMGEVLAEAYRAEDYLVNAHAVVIEMRTQRLPLGSWPQLELVRYLAKADLFALANEIFAPLHSTRHVRKYYMIGLYLSARQGHVVNAEEFYKLLMDNDWFMPVIQCWVMHAYAVAGRVETVVELFHQFFPKDSANGAVDARPTILHYTTIIFAYAERSDYDGLNHWLQAMLDAGHSPDGHVYNIILKSFSSRGEVDSVSAILDQMRSARIMPTHVHYTSVITLLAQRKDPIAAEAIYKRAVHEGVIPDRRMITTLMNAHVESGSWAGVVRVFDYLKESNNIRLLTIEVYNTLLKAYVHIGSPFQVVAALFRKLQRAGLRPDGHTYALVIQSACDAGLMNVAEDLFAEMEAKAQEWEPFHRLDAFVLTIIMAGHLRLGHKAYAKASEAFLKSIMDTDQNHRGWMTTGSRPAVLENLHSPLMLAHTNQSSPRDVERIFEAMIEAGGEPSIQSLTILSDVYRRTGNLKAINRVWPQIWQLAVRLSRVDGLFGGDDTDATDSPPRHSSLLCVPLSIYIDALSAAGQADAIPHIWNRARSNGFGFDSHNWNHLAIALVRAAELERAFEVLERVVLPYQRQSELSGARNSSPESPYTFDSKPPDLDDPASDSPMGRKKRRVLAVKITTSKSGSRLDMEESSTDFAHPLHILHNVMPSWSTWRPHTVTLKVLSQVLKHLQGGRLVQPVTASNEPQLPGTAEDSETRAKIASDILQRIYDNYPDTLRVITLYDRQQSRQDAINRLDDGWGTRW